MSELLSVNFGTFTSVLFISDATVVESRDSLSNKRENGAETKLRNKLGSLEHSPPTFPQQKQNLRQKQKKKVCLGIFLFMVLGGCSLHLLSLFGFSVLRPFPSVF